MPLATFDRTPPPFFRQGPSALTKLSLCSALALFLMVADTRFKLTQPVRAVVATALHPAEMVLRAPVDAVTGAGAYLMGLQAALTNEARAQQALAAQAERAARADQLWAENARLRVLLELRPALTVRTQAAEILYEASDPYSRKVIIDRGATHGVVRGAPVINDAGVLGQVTRAYPLSAEVTLLTDKDAAIPVLNQRTQVRSAAFGAPAPAGMELRFMAANADVQVGDVLSTSGVDGVYPPGLLVARVVSVDRKVESGFARIALMPAASADAVRHVLVLEPLGLQLPPQPASEAPSAPTAAKKASAAHKTARKPGAAE